MTSSLSVVQIVVLMVYHAFFGKLNKEEVPVLQYIPLGIISAIIIAGILLGERYVNPQDEINKIFMLWATVGFMAGANQPHYRVVSPCFQRNFLAGIRFR